MSKFDFITSEPFRESLEADYKELGQCVEAGALKAAHVLAGSIIEALLADYLVAMDAGEEATIAKLGLAELVSMCRDKNLISAKVADLSSAIRGYRNLIHPGRAVRTAESVDEHSAAIAARLVELIVAEVAEQKKQVYGFTAEQIVGKLQSDPSAIAIVEHLLRSVRPIEIERLLLRVLPERQLESDGPFDDSEYLEQCFSSAYKLADKKVKKRIALKYVEVLQQEPEALIRVHDVHFFQLDFLDQISANQAELVKHHLLAVLHNSGLYPRIRGFAQRLDADEVGSFVDPLVRVCTKPNSPYENSAAEKFLKEEMFWLDEDVEIAFRERLQHWKSLYENRDQPVYANTIRRVLGEEEVPTFDEDDDLPF